MGFLGTLLRQAICLAALFALPWAWFTLYMQGPSEITPELAAESRTLISLGCCLVVEGLLYRALPFDAIPSWLPILGSMDDMLAGMVVGVGAVMAYLGWEYGAGVYACYLALVPTGDRPQEAVYVVETVLYLYELSLPMLRVALQAAERAAAVVIPVVMAALDKAGPVLRGVYNQTVALAAPLIESVVAPKVMEAAKEAAGEL